jgi:predicted ATPase with chaperone activity
MAPGETSKANGKMAPPEIRKHCRLNREAEQLLKTAMEELGLSARAHDKIVRVGRTIADLDASENIAAVHLSESINYRTLTGGIGLEGCKTADARINPSPSYRWHFCLRQP